MGAIENRSGAGHRTRADRRVARRCAGGLLVAAVGITLLAAVPGVLSVLFADRGHSAATGCSPLPIAIDGVGSILWNDNSTSEFNFRVNTNPLADRFGLEANITGGTLAGGRITALPLLLLQDGLCGLGGVGNLSANFGFDVFTHRPPLAAGR